MKEDSMFTQGVTMQTMGNEERKTPCSHKELRFKQWVMKEDSLFTQGVCSDIIGFKHRDI
ncbi:hypothetical protein KSS87_012472 [Heliosperma pusillum]|nr:hypothetical protein KSS87_012472 [Heliosperma pusillum]